MICIITYIIQFVKDYLGVSFLPLRMTVVLLGYCVRSPISFSASSVVSVDFLLTLSPELVSFDSSAMSRSSSCVWFDVQEGLHSHIPISPSGLTLVK